MENHRLRREIITDVLANRIVNLAGPVFVSRMKETTRAPVSEIARTYVVAEGAFGLSKLKEQVDALDGKIDAAVQTAMYTEIAELLRRLGLWFIVNVPADADFSSTIALYRSGLEKLKGTFEGLVSEYEKKTRSIVSRSSRRRAFRTCLPMRSARCPYPAQRRRSRRSPTTRVLASISSRALISPWVRKLVSTVCAACRGALWALSTGIVSPSAA
ncbi:MAG: hypothetical protein WDM89_10320 [Rhizomicrobium sp.]